MNLSRKITMMKIEIIVIFIFFIAFVNIPPVFSQQSSAQLLSLEFNTPSEFGLDIVFIPEDYTLEGMDTFRETVETYYKKLLSIEPFLGYVDRINIWRIDTVIDFGLTRDPTMNRRYNIDYDKVRQFVESIIEIDLDFTPPNDLIIVLVNDSTYGGSGYSNVAIAYTGELGTQVMIHEVGHSFGNLGDEYVLYDEDYPAGQDIPYPNIDWDGSKWKDIPGTGAYLGAWYRNLVRPTNDSCTMRKVEYGGYCPVCDQALAPLLEYYSPPYKLLYLSITVLGGIIITLVLTWRMLKIKKRSINKLQP